MNSNLAWARLLVREPLPTVARAQALERIERNTLTQLALVDEVFDLTLFASGQPHLELTAVDLTGIAIATVDTFSATAAENCIALRLHRHEAPHVVLADRRHVTQLLGRLIGHVLRNATQHDCVDVTVTREATHEIVRVAMAARAGSVHVHRLLADDPAQASRSDSGLYLATKLAALHDSDVELHTDPANRSIAFTVRLKALDIEEGQQVMDIFQAEPLRALGGTRVLIVDDDPDTREILGVR